MNFNLPSRKIVYKTGIMMVNRLDEPLYQCRLATNRSLMMRS